jgi:hypothetical protein
MANLEQKIFEGQGPEAVIIWQRGGGISFGVNVGGGGGIIVSSFSSCFK